MSAAWILLDSQVKRLEPAGLPRVCPKRLPCLDPTSTVLCMSSVLPFCLGGRCRLRIERRRICAPRELGEAREQKNRDWPSCRKEQSLTDGSLLGWELSWVSHLLLRGRGRKCGGGLV